MESGKPAELLQQLLDACNEGRDDAIRLAQRTDIEPLRAFLQESARQYCRAVDDIRMICDEAVAAPAARGGSIDLDRDEDIVASWERAECEALTHFRDVYDMPLPSAVADTVKRHYEAGVARLEQLRRLQTRLAPRRAN